MKDFMSKLKTYPNLKHLDGASQEEISNAEKVLDLNFSNEYKEYLKAYGTAIANGHEFTGICKSQRLNVVDTTINAKELNPNIPSKLYLVEDTHFDEMLIWQDEKGIVYQSDFSTSPVRLCDSLFDYMEL